MQASQFLIVTGAASGIGLSIASYFKERGHHVACFDINRPPAESGLAFFHCDVSDEMTVIQAYQAAKKQFGPCHALINNSGLQYMAPVDEFPLEKWNLLLGVMLTGPFLLSKVVIPDMKARRSGRIINISSVHGKVASPFKAAYVAAKHGVLGLSKVMAKELGEYGITVNSICPGFVDTPLMRAQVKKQMDLNQLEETAVLEQVFLKDQSIKKLTSPEQIAQMVEFLLSDAASTITGEAYNISGGWGM